MNVITKEQIQNWYADLQGKICKSLEELDGKSKFSKDVWYRKEGGGGISKVIQNGDLIEKGGVNYSAVHGLVTAKLSSMLGIQANHFFASGISIVLHPKNPWVPIIHSNLRYFELDTGQWWFGGGIDLTPHIVLKEKAQSFHKMLKDTCDKYATDYYPKFKEAADNYFFIPHRNESRGIGGIFFDKLNESKHVSKTDLWRFVQDIGGMFIPIYLDAVAHVRDKAYSKKDVAWQKIRRGRYVEFNLIYDKGTKFGLDTNGRIESILMSLPPIAAWDYLSIEPNEAQAYTLSRLKKDIDWIS